MQHPLAVQQRIDAGPADRAGPQVHRLQGVGYVEDAQLGAVVWRAERGRLAGYVEELLEDPSIVCGGCRPAVDGLDVAVDDDTLRFRIFDRAAVYAAGFITVPAEPPESSG